MISVDPLDDNKGFASQQHADFPLLSDPAKPIFYTLPASRAPDLIEMGLVSRGGGSAPRKRSGNSIPH
jgi:peroxiredoxin